jgi:hypothetical protein
MSFETGHASWHGAEGHWMQREASIFAAFRSNPM